MDWRAHVRTALDGEHPVVGRSVVLLLYGLIGLSTISIGIDTLPDLPLWVSTVLSVGEVVTVVVFTVEYGLRIAVSPKPLAYVRSFFGIVDLLAIVPFYLSLGIDLRALRAFRLLRLLRLFKVVRYNGALRRLGRAIHMVREELIIFVCFALFTLYLCGIGIYYFEHAAQPKAFASVFDGMWWATVTLTTVGYGDIYPITAGGRMFTVLVLFVALGAIAIPTGLISAALTRVREMETDASATAAPADSSDGNDNG
jgi:voltage-gated potassium channel